MNAKELMIGDWVTYIPEIEEGEESYLGEPYSIQVDLPCLQKVDELIFAPIPLTTEILEKNGFVLRGKTYILKWRGAEIHWRKTDGYASITAPNNLKLEGWCSISNGYFCYVHILQHALRLCGFDELAENFKV